MLPGADRATPQPNESPRAPWEAASTAVWDQVPPRSLNTYAVPVPECRGAPTRAVVPRAERATEIPKESNGAPWGAVSSAVWDQVPPRSLNT